MRQIRRSIAECIADADFVSLAPSDVVASAAEGMREKGTHCAVIVEDGILVGIFTERDYLNRVSVEQRDPRTTKLGDVMTRTPIRLRSYDCVSYAINQMAVRGVRNIPIVDAMDRPVSVLDVRLVIMHLIKVFAEIEQGVHSGNEDQDDDAWVDIGGGD